MAESDPTKVSVSWSDGAGAQVKVLIDPDEVDSCNIEMIIANKHSKNRSTVEQPCDVSPCFFIMKRTSKVNTALEAPNGFLVKRFNDRFSEIEKESGIYLKDHKKHLIDFLATMPATYCKSMSPKNVLIGFIGTGMIDSKTFTWPDLNVIMQTCKNPEIKNKTVQKNFEENFEEMYNEQNEKGMLSDAFMISKGVPEDRDMNGSVAAPKVSDHNESSHRSKNMTHAIWAWFRKNRIEERKKKIEAADNKTVSLTENYHKMNLDAEKAIVGCLPPDESNWKRVDMKKFYKVTRPLLYAYRYVRTFSQVSSTNSLPNPNRGTFEHVSSGGDSSHTLAYNMFGLPVKLESKEACAERLRKKREN